MAGLDRRDAAGRTMMWAQTGFRRERTGGGTAINNYRYWEIFGTTSTSFYDVHDPPADNSSTPTVRGGQHHRHLGLRGRRHACGTAYRRGLGGHHRDRADYVGEIFNPTDDMPGTASNKCTFRDCKKKSSGGSYVDAGPHQPNVRPAIPPMGRDPVSATGMDIWDKNPLP